MAGSGPNCRSSTRRVTPPMINCPKHVDYVVSSPTKKRFLQSVFYEWKKDFDKIFAITEKNPQSSPTKWHNLSDLSPVLRKLHFFTLKSRSSWSPALLGTFFTYLTHEPRMELLWTDNWRQCWYILSDYSIYIWYVYIIIIEVYIYDIYIHIYIYINIYLSTTLSISWGFLKIFPIQFPHFQDS